MLSLAQSAVRHAHVTLVLAPLENSQTHIAGVIKEQQVYNGALLSSFENTGGLFLHNER